MAKVSLTLASSQGIVQVFLWVIFGSGCGCWENSIFCTLFGDASSVHGVIQYCWECLLFIWAETWQGIWKFLLLLLLFQGQKLARLEADIQSLRETTLRAFLLKLNDTVYPEGKKNFLRQIALNLEHRNLLISILIEDNVVRWVGQQPWCHSGYNPILREVKNSYVTHSGQLLQRVLQTEFLQEQKKPTYWWQNMPYSSQKCCNIIKIMDLGNTSPSWRKRHFFFYFCAIGL